MHLTTGSKVNESGNHTRLYCSAEASAESVVIEQGALAPDDAFFNQLKDIFSVRDIDPRVRSYIAETYAAEKCAGPFYINGARNSLKHLFTYATIFGVEGPTEAFPALMAGSLNGTTLYAMLATGQVLSIHHDSLSDVGWDYFTDGDTNPSFLEKVLKGESLFSLGQLLNLSSELSAQRAHGIADNLTLAQMREIVARSFGWSEAELDKATGKLAMEFLRELIEEEE